jgi:tetratricopeptide (TPR) repeat protein
MLDLSNKYKGKKPPMADYIQPDKDQKLVMTPYGNAMVIRTLRHKDSGEIKMQELELTDWVKPSSGSGPQKPSMLYSPTEFPSVEPQIGDEVMTIYGRGRVVDIRANSMVVVRISSWRLASRSIVTCYLSRDAVQVVRPKTLYEMSTVERIEHAQELKQKASEKFSAKEYEEALIFYSKAVDAVRYVQHSKEIENETRADLLVVMITCCNNAATCCSQLQQWDRAINFAQNALVLIEALEEKKPTSKICSLLNRDGYMDSQLFGTWKVKSCLVIGRGEAEKHHTQKAIDTLKKALEVFSEYKNESDPNYQQLVAQEKQVRKLYLKCKDRLKAEIQREKRAAQAMFGGSSKTEEKKDAEKRSAANISDASTPALEQVSSQSPIESTDEDELKLPHRDIPKKRVSFADGKIPGDFEDEPSFWEEHKEAIILAGGMAIGSFLAFSLFGKKKH